MTLIARGIRAETCPNGCAVFVLLDDDGHAFAEAHIMTEGLEAFIADLRMAAKTCEAMQRPVS